MRHEIGRFFSGEVDSLSRSQYSKKLVKQLQNDSQVKRGNMQIQ